VSGALQRPGGNIFAPSGEVATRDLSRWMHSLGKSQRVSGESGPLSSRVGVVVPSRNRWPLLRTALASALAQGEVVRVVVVDDGSTDVTADELAAVADERLTVVSNERPRGVSVARNIGLAHVDTPWVAFLDDDDTWGPGHIAGLLEAARGSGLSMHRIGLVYGGHLVTDAQRGVTHVKIADPADSLPGGLREENLIGTPSGVLMPRDAVLHVGGFDERLAIVADWDLWVRILAKREAVRCPGLLLAYMEHPGNMHHDGDRLLRELSQLREKHGWPRGRGRHGLPGERLPLYVASSYRASGRRLRAASWYLRSFMRRRDRRDLGRAAGMLVGERLIEMSGLKQPKAVEPKVGRWLEEIRRAERDAGTGLPALAGARRHDRLGA
jgi:glycosyltransferase involved in cell wall biosynthesis